MYDKFVKEKTFLHTGVLKESFQLVFAEFSHCAPKERALKDHRVQGCRMCFEEFEAQVGRKKNEIGQAWAQDGPILSLRTRMVYNPVNNHLLICSLGPWERKGCFCRKADQMGSFSLQWVLVCVLKHPRGENMGSDYCTWNLIHVRPALVQLWLHWFQHGSKTKFDR